MGVTTGCAGAHLQPEALGGQKICVDRGSGVTFVHHDAPNPPASPNPPRRSYSHHTGDLIENDAIDVPAPWSSGADGGGDGVQGAGPVVVRVGDHDLGERVAVE